MSLANLNDISTPVSIPTLNTSALVLGGSSVVSIQSGIVPTAESYPVYVAFDIPFKSIPSLQTTCINGDLYPTEYDRSASANISYLGVDGFTIASIVASNDNHSDTKYMPVCWTAISPTQ